MHAFWAQWVHFNCHILYMYMIRINIGSRNNEYKISSLDNNNIIKVQREGDHYSFKIFCVISSLLIIIEWTEHRNAYVCHEMGRIKSRRY